MQQVFHTWILGSSAILPSDLLQFHEVSGAIFMSLWRCSIRFRSGLWQGQSRMVSKLFQNYSFFILAVCFNALSCWKLNLRPNLRGWAPGRGYLLGCLCSWPHSSFLQLLSVILYLHPHSMILPPLYFTVGVALHRWCLCLSLVSWSSAYIPLKINAKKFKLRLIRGSELTITICVHS